MLFDLVVIGSGPSGMRAALQGAKAGKKVAIIEAQCLGGACVHSGTLPSKSFRESVYRWALGSKGTLGRETESFLAGEGAPKKPSKGSGARAPMPDIARLLRRVNRVVQGEIQVVTDQLKRNGVTVYTGTGKLVSANDIEVQTKRGVEKLTASVIIIATGGRPVSPPHLPVDGKTVLDSDTILTLKRIPKRLVVLGAGIIGCEYASMFAMAGSKVTLIDRRHEILASVDREIVDHLVERFNFQGVEVILETEATRINTAKKGGTGVQVVLSNGKKISTDAVLIAQGRAGNIQNLGLEEVGVATSDRGLITVDRNYRTNLPNIYAVGDVIGPPALASTSMEEGRIACAHAFGLEAEPMPSNFPYGIYTIPEIAMLGPTEEELKSRKVDYLVGRARYRELARGQIVGDRWGLLKLLVDKKTLGILGVHIVGDNAADLIHIGQAVMHFGGDIHYFIRNVFNYPTLAEAYKVAAFAALNQAKKK